MTQGGEGSRFWAAPQRGTETHIRSVCVGPLPPTIQECLTSLNKLRTKLATSRTRPATSKTVCIHGSGIYANTAEAGDYVQKGKDFVNEHGQGLKDQASKLQQTGQDKTSGLGDQAQNALNQAKDTLGLNK